MMASLLSRTPWVVPMGFTQVLLYIILLFCSLLASQAMACHEGQEMILLCHWTAVCIKSHILHPKYRYEHVITVFVLLNEEKSLQNSSFK